MRICQSFPSIKQNAYTLSPKNNIKHLPRRHYIMFCRKEQFFSLEYAKREDLFQNLSIWKEEKYRKLQGTFPVIFLSFAKLKETSFINTRRKICRIIKNLYNHFDFLLANGKTLCTKIDEQIVFSQLNSKRSAIWSLMLASGYLRLKNYTFDEECGQETYELALTNREVLLMFKNMIEDWFAEFTPAYNKFIQALLAGDKKAMNLYMNKVLVWNSKYMTKMKKIVLLILLRKHWSRLNGCNTQHR